MAPEHPLGRWLGPLEDLLRDPDVSEILVIDHDRVFVEREGRLHPDSRSLPGRQALQELIERLLVPLGRELTQAVPYADGRMGDSIRFTATIPPLTPAPTLTIRKEAAIDVGDAWDTLLGLQSPMRILQSWVRERRNVVIAGAAGSGKTSLLRRLAQDIPPGERILTIEETRELALHRFHPHVVELETRPPNRAGLYGIDLEELIRLCLHMRPDRIIVGEIRGREAFSWLGALDSGHPGGLTTLHATSSKDVEERLLFAMSQAATVPAPLLKSRIRALVGGVVHLRRLADGTRRPESLVAYENGRPQAVWP